MTQNWLVYVCLFLGLSSALVGGVFQAFSDFVMRGLIAASPKSGAQSMQMLNRTVFRSVFLVMLIGLAPVSFVVAVYAYFALDALVAYWLVAAAAIYIITVFMVTVVGNVPMNNRLDALELDSAEAMAFWQHYSVRWTQWNHIRTLGAILAAICFLMTSVAL